MRAWSIVVLGLAAVATVVRACPYGEPPEHVWERKGGVSGVDDVHEVYHTNFGNLMLCQKQCEENGGHRIKYNKLDGDCHCYKDGDDTVSINAGLGWELWEETDEDTPTHLSRPEYVWDKGTAPEDIKNAEEVFHTMFGNLFYCQTECEEQEGETIKYNPWDGACHCYKAGSEEYPFTAWLGYEFWEKSGTKRHYDPEYVWDIDEDPPDTIADVSEVYSAHAAALEECELQCELAQGNIIKFNPYALGACHCYGSGNDSIETHTGHGNQIWHKSTTLVSSTSEGEEGEDSEGYMGSSWL